MDLNNTELIVRGCVTFGNGITKKIAQKLKFKKNCQVFSSIEWSLKKLQLTQYGGKSIFLYIKQARCEFLIICQINSTQLIKQILLVNYVNLKSLKFLDTAIYNIEIIAFLNLPALKYVDILFSEINNTKSFAKTNWPNIQTIVLISNKFDSPFQKSFLSRIKTKNQFSNLGFSWLNADFCVFAKFQAQKVTYLQYFIQNESNDLLGMRFERFFRLRYCNANIKTIQFQKK